MVRAAVFTGVDQPQSIETLEAAEPGPGQVAVRMGASGVCHTEESIRTGALPVPPPMVLGHEGAGVVDAVGPGVSSVRPGDTVVLASVAQCGTCWMCARGAFVNCEGVAERRPTLRRADGAAVPSFAGLGTFGDYAVVDENAAVAVRTDLPVEQLALIGCGVITGMGAALNTAKVQPGSTVAVVGLGGIGQSIIQGAKVAGASTIVAIDPLANKRDMAARLGATHTVNPADGDVGEQVRSLTDGRGADYSFEAVGLESAINDAWAAAREAGTVTIVGFAAFDATFTLSAPGVVLEHKTLHASKYGSANIRKDFQLIADLAAAGHIDLGSMVTRTLTLDEVDGAFEAMNAGEVIRSVIRY